MIAFLDASVLIYIVEGAQPFASSARAVLANVTAQNPGITVALSRLSWLEGRVRPMRERNTDVLAAFDQFFSRTDLIWIELTRAVVELATAIRATHGLRTPDSLQAASCLQLGPQHLFLSGDEGFKRVQDLQAVIIR